MGRAIQAMKNALGSFGVYQLEQSLIEAELAAYQAGLEKVMEDQERLWQDLFIQTASEEEISRKELMFGPERPLLDLESRRKMLLFRNAVTENDYTREALKRDLVAIGLETDIVEQPEQEKIEINVIRVLGEFDSQEQAQQMAEEFLPAHLLYEFDFRNLFWDTVDAKEMTFDAMDAADLKWDEIDAYEGTVL